MKATRLLVVIGVLLLAGCMQIQAMPATDTAFSRPPEILLPGPYEAPESAPVLVAVKQAPVQYSADILRGVYEAPAAALEVKEVPVLSTSDILRGVY